jgi:hypothetical protein
MSLRLLDLAEQWLLDAKVKINEGLKAVGTAVDALTTLIAYGTNAYVEGTFTPAVTFGGGNTGITYTTQSGFYTRIGRMVHVELTVLLSAKGSSTGAAVITGLPLAVAATCAGHYQMSAMTAGVGDTYLQGAFTGTQFNLQDISGGSAAQITDVDFSATTLIRINGVYRTSA